MTALANDAETYRQALALIHKIDEIRDKHSRLRDILRLSLITILEVIECKLIFIQYINIYDEHKTLTIEIWERKEGHILNNNYWSEIINRFVHAILLIAKIWEKQILR